MVRRLLFSLLGAALLAVAAWLLVHWLERPPEVAVGRVEREDVVRVLAVTGRVRPRHVNHLRPLAAGRLVELAREEGDRVRRGEVLARLDARDAEAGLGEARAALTAARQELAQARRDLERAERLFADGLIPAEQLERRRLALEQSEQGVEQHRQAVTEATVRLEDYVLIAPLTGWVLERPVDPGQVVDRETVVYEIATGEDPWVEAEIDEIFLAELVPGMAALAAAPGNRGGRWELAIERVGRRVDPETGAATVRFAFTGEAPSLPAGLALDINVAVARHEGAITAPRTALADLDGQPWALIVADGRTVRRRIGVIDWPAERVVITKGLTPGERIVLAPRRVAAGIEVRARPEDGGSR